MIKQKIANNLKNIIGKSVKEKFLIIESDDWGSIRMPSLKAFDRLKSKGVSLGAGEGGRYNRTDSLAGAEDLDALFNTLRRFKDGHGNHPVFTAISVVANPDFEKIKANNFTKYAYEPFTHTLEKYQRADAFVYWKEGLEQKLFVPEFHGREHLNVPFWMRNLQKQDKYTLAAFEEGCWGFKIDNKYGLNYQAAFDVEFKSDIDAQEEILKTGLQLFEKLHGYKANFFVPPNGPFNNRLEKIASTEGVKFMGAAKVQYEPQGEGKTKRRYHWLGQKNEHGQIYLTRNAFFEPNAPGKDWVSTCLEDIHYAFLWGKPAVISSHRTNYIGSLNEKNRMLGLQKLTELLTAVTKKWPDVEFVTSTDLGNHLVNSKN